MHLTSVSPRLALGDSPQLLLVITGNLWDLSRAQGQVCSHDVSDPVAGACGRCPSGL